MTLTDFLFEFFPRYFDPPQVERSDDLFDKLRKINDERAARGQGPYVPVWLVK